MVKGNFELPKDLVPVFATTNESVAIESGMALVYKGLILRNDTKFGTRGSNSFVVKYGKWIGNPDLVFDNFEFERKALEYFRDPNVIEIKDANFNGKLPWLVLEDGGLDLYDTAITKKSGNLEKRLKTVEGFLKGLAAIHKREASSHGDVKPENVVEKGKLIDFGHCVMPGYRQYKGTTFSYIPPEEEDISPWADIFQAGLVLACVIKGTSNLGITNRTNVKITPDKKRLCYFYTKDGKLIIDTPDLIQSELRISFYKDEGYKFYLGDDDLDEIIARATRKNPVERYRNATEMLEDLIAFKEKLNGTTDHIPSPLDSFRLFPFDD